MNNLSQNLFASCVFKVNKDINWNKTALEKITNNLQFEVISIDPLTIKREGLSEEIFAKLTETLRKCISPNDSIKFRSEHFGDIKINEDSDQVKHGSVVNSPPLPSYNNTSPFNQPEKNNLENEPGSLKCDSKNQNSATLENVESLHEEKTVFNTLNHNHETNNFARRDSYHSENSSASFVVLEKEVINTEYAKKTDEDYIERGDQIETRLDKNVIEESQKEEKSKNEYFKKDKKEKNSKDFPDKDRECVNSIHYLQRKEHDFKEASLVDLKARQTDIFAPDNASKINVESEKKTLKTEEKKEASIQHHKDVLQKAQCVPEKEATTDHTEASTVLLSDISQRSNKKVNQNVDEFRNNDFENEREINQHEHQICESTSSNCENFLILKFNETNFKAAKYYFKDSNFDKYFSRAKDMNKSYVIEIHKKEKTLTHFEQLRNFKSSKITDVDETEAFQWEQTVKDKFPIIKTLYTPTKRSLQIMGPKDKVSASKSLIISLRGNKDHEMMWSKPSNEMKNSSEHFVKSQSQESSFMPNHLETDKYNEPINNDSTRKIYFTDREELNDEEIVKNLKLQVKDQLKPASFEGPKLRNIISSSQGLIYVGNNLKVTVRKANITKLNVDIIVNAANRHLEHKGGVALAIAEAAGSKLQKECEDFIQQHKALEVTGIFVSSGGKLKARKVIHAVGPKWDLYVDKDKCLQDLRHTILRCLVEASRLGEGNIAMPSISAAIFRVPPKLCAKNYMAAVKHFDCIRKELKLTSLQEIMFVDVNDDLVRTIQEEFNLKWKLEPDKDLVKEDLNFAKQHLQKSDGNLKVKISSQPSGAKPKEPKRSSSFSRVIGAKATTNGKTYEHKSLKINVSVKPALTSSNELVFVVGEPFDLMSGLHNFSVKKHLQEDKNAKKIKKLKLFKSMYLGKTSNVYSLKCKIKDKEDLEKALDILASMDLSNLSDKKEYSLVITSNIFFHGKTQNDFKLMGTLAAALHTFIQNVSTNTCVKHLRISINEDALTSVMKVFDSRKDIKEVENDEHTNKNKPRDSYHHEHRSLEKRLSGDGKTSYPYGRLASDNLKSGREQLASYNSNPEAQGESSVDDESLCQICLTEKCCVPLDCCKKNLCRKCQHKCASCPFCRKIFGTLKGNQPDGDMKVQYLNTHAAGFEHCCVWEITYTFPSGRQKEFHPSPGQFYCGITRIAYLPNTKEGYDVLLRLKIAFMRRLTFTIGHSVTLNVDNKITWNDIHHKTSLSGGSHGYPDSSYLMRVAQELTDKGVTLESMTTREIMKLDEFEQYLHTSMNVLQYPAH